MSISDKEKMEQTFEQTYETKKMLKELGKSEEIISLVTRLGYSSLQFLKDRYNYINNSRKDGNFHYFKKISDFLYDEGFYYWVKD